MTKKKSFVVEFAVGGVTTRTKMIPSKKFEGFHQIVKSPDAHYDLRTARKCPISGYVVVDYTYTENGSTYITDSSYFNQEFFNELKKYLPIEYKKYRLRSIFN